jgi:general secretion pathway protein M
MMNWWESLQPRERLILGAGGIVAMLIVMWEFAWKPLTEGREQLRTSVAAKEQLLSEVARASGIDSTGAGPAVGSGQQSMFVLIDETATASGLGSAITRARPDGSNAINVTFSNASFDSLLTWLIALNLNSGVWVDGASINTARQQGLVSGQLLLRRG